MELKELLPEENSIIVNLHNWNGEGCISGAETKPDIHCDCIVSRYS